MRGIEMTLDWQTAYKNHKNISTTIAPPSFFTDQLLVRNRRLFWNNFFVGKDSKGGAKELPHRTIQISRYDIFISRYGMYIFIPAMMTFTLMYVLCLKWKCLDTDLVGIHGVSAIFQSAGRRMLHRLSPSVRKDPLLGKMYVVKHGSKMEERKIKELFRGVSGMGRNIIWVDATIQTGRQSTDVIKYSQVSFSKFLLAGSLGTKWLQLIRHEINN